MRTRLQSQDMIAAAANKKINLSTFAVADPAHVYAKRHKTTTGHLPEGSPPRKPWGAKT